MKSLRPKTVRLLRGLTAPACVVLGTRSLTGLSILRSLGGNGVVTIGVDVDRVNLGALSRFCSVTETCSSEAERLALLQALGEASPQRNAILCESDELVLFIDRHRRQLERHYALGIPGEGVLRGLIDKTTMTAVARAAGLSVPRTGVYPEMSLEELGRTTSFPALVKPVHTQPAERCKAVLVADAAALEAAVRRERFRDGCVVQELIPGDETNLWTCMGYATAGADPVALVTGHKIRQRPPDFGVGTLVVSQDNRTVKELTRRFLRHAGHVGCFELEFKRRSGDEYVFIEINPRVCALNSLAVAAGADLAYLAYRDACGMSLQRPGPQADGVRWIDAILDFDTCSRYYRRRGAGVLRDWARQARRGEAHAVFDRRDMKPFLFNLAKYLAKSALGAFGISGRRSR